MTIRTKTALGVLVLMGALTPGIAAARPCTVDETVLISCTVEGGARTLNLCLAGDTLHYAFGPTGFLGKIHPDGVEVDHIDAGSPADGRLALGDQFSGRW